MAPNTIWRRTDDGSVFYTTPREYSIERLDNGYFRVFHYGPGLSSLHATLVDAYYYCTGRVLGPEVVA